MSNSRWGNHKAVGNSQGLPTQIWYIKMAGHKRIYLPFFDPSVKYDIQTLDDPLPGIMDIWFMIKKVFGFLSY